MSKPTDKKTFADAMAIRRSDELDAMFPDGSTQQGQAPAAAPGRPRRRTDTADGRQQITFKLPADIIEDLRAMAYWDRMEQWQIVADALAASIQAYKDDHGGTLEPIPKK